MPEFLGNRPREQIVALSDLCARDYPVSDPITRTATFRTTGHYPSLH